ncbi:MAG: hypothetical protein QM644_18445 [Mobilitalea sp.]
MGKIVDITEKLNFDENPKLKIKNISCEVNADAPTMLKLMQLIGDGNNMAPKDLIAMYELIFSKEDRMKIDKLKLQFNDFQAVVMTAISLVTGESNQGE